MMKLALMRTATGKEDPDLPLLQRISSLELTAPRIAASQSSSNRHIQTSIDQRRLRESILHGRIASKKPLLKGHQQEEENTRFKRNSRGSGEARCVITQQNNEDRQAQDV